MLLLFPLGVDIITPKAMSSDEGEEEEVNQYINQTDVEIIQICIN